MQKPNIWIVLIIFIIFYHPITYGQQSEENISVLGIKKLSGFEEKGVFIRTKMVDSTSEVIVFIINNSGESIRLSSYYGSALIKTAAINEGGQWQNIDPIIDGDCGTGYGLSEMPSQTYTYIKKPLKNNGNFKTKLRYEISFPDTTIFSRAFEVRIDPDYFSSLDKRVLDQINIELNKDRLTREDTIQIKLLKVNYLKYWMKNIARAIEECKKIKEVHGESDELKFELGMLYLHSLSQFTNEPIAIQQGIICAAFEEWEIIVDLPPKMLQQKKKFEKIYEKFLPSNKGEVKAQLNCLDGKDGGIRCYVEAGVNKFVKIKFKEDKNGG